MSGPHLVAHEKPTIFVKDAAKICQCKGCVLIARVTASRAIIKRRERKAKIHQG